MALGYQYGSPDVLGLQRLARASGLLYLVLAVFGMFSALTLESLVVPGDAVATAAGILDSLWLFGSSLVGWIVIVVAVGDVAVTGDAFGARPASVDAPIAGAGGNAR